MALVVEDGTGKPLANAYIDVAFADAYFAARAQAQWATYTQEQKEAAIIAATDYIDVRFGPRMRGTKQHKGQGLQFPRLGVPCAPAGAVPPQVQKACAEYAVRAAKGPLAPDPTVDNSGQAVIGQKRKVGPIETDVKYKASTSGGEFTGMKWKPYPMADALLTCVLWSGSKVMRN